MKKLLLLALILAACQTTTILEDPVEGPVVEEEEKLNISSTACDAPDYTYPLLTYESWNGIEFGLPWCWGATEEGDTLRLEHGEGEAWVEITMGSGTLPNPLPVPTRTDHEDYTLFDYEGYLYLETNKPDHSNVQDILYSISTL